MSKKISLKISHHRVGSEFHDDVKEFREHYEPSVNKSFPKFNYFYGPYRNKTKSPVHGQRGGHLRISSLVDVGDIPKESSPNRLKETKYKY